MRNRESAFHPQNINYKWWLLGNIMIGTFMAVLDSTIVNVALPKIMTSFGVGIDKIEWVSTAYMLAMAVMLPTSGWMADKFGYKRIYFFGLLFFTLGSLLCGMSGNEDMLIFSRVIQGFGAGAVQPLGMAIISREFPPKQRGIALGFWAIAAAASVSFGPLIGGYLVDNFTWQLIFDVNVPIGILGMAATVIIQSEYKNKKVRKFDMIGFISATIFLPLLLYALSQGNTATNSEGWGAPYILVCFAISFIGMIVFITQELTVKEPLLDLRLLGNRNFGISSLVMLLFSIGMFGSTFLLPLYLQNSLGYTALQAGAVFLPVGIIQGAMSPTSGFLANKINPKWIIITGVLLLTLSFYVNSSFSYLTERPYIMLGLYLRGFAMGIIFTPLNTISLSQIPRDKMAQASGVTNTVRQIGGSLGVAILTTVLTSRVTYHSQLYSEALNANAPIYKEVTSGLQHFAEKQVGSTPAKAAQQGQVLLVSHIEKQAYIEGVDDDFLLVAIITLLGGSPALLLRKKKKNA
ncbi:DHA2 family efflux MFS transporter permease subunit [uncultured Bacteroides sp.]|uniref:DHA2 family efflux MFS transporter permease subunit n=1 Tax=uncultured Bacteroides sp. TaxID=162156 RepID=UPI002AAB75FA|nr:DHA2 family efflux MFS transporter permease subunit [uncultured Bacteroides sp.]